MQLHAALRHRQQAVQRHALDSRHRSHNLSTVFPIEQEHRIDQVIGREDRLAHQSAGEIIAPHVPHAHRGELPVDIHDADFLGGFGLRNFRRRRQSYLQTMQVVSRFSSLSGCLNLN
jgi:hypothetical protein